MRLHDGRVLRFPAVMGVLNVTPDSFSDGGLFLDPERALEHALEMQAAGADIIDVGGESTRPHGAREVPRDVELARVAPVIQKLGRRLRVPISVDTRKAVVAQCALEAGAAIVNDVSALEADPEMAGLTARWKCVVVLMHMRGSVENHIKFAGYGDVVADVIRYLAERAHFASGAGIKQSRIIIDPGLGFAKTADHSLQVLGSLSRICALGYPVLIGASRKGFIRKVAGIGDDNVRFGTAAVNALAVAGGASIIRVHEPAPALVAAKVGAAVAALRNRT